MSAYLIIIRDDTTLKTEILKVAVKFFTLTLTIILNINCRGKSATLLLMAHACSALHCDGHNGQMPSHVNSSLVHIVG